MSLYNDDELVAPSWINEEFLLNVLTKYENNRPYGKVMRFEISPASIKGDHYASIMFRCKVTYRFGCCVYEKSLIIKTLPMEDGMKRDLLMESKLFETEIDMYSETLPKIEKILAECGEATKLCPELIYYSLEPHKVIIMEDLCESGYDTIRGRYLTEDEIKAVYRKIARLHAVSYMLGQSDNSEFVTKYQKGIFATTAVMEMDIMAHGVDKFIDMLSHHKEFEIYLEKLKAMQPDIMKCCKAIYDVPDKNSKNSDSDIFVLNHGDFHLKNLMFKFNDSKHLEDLVMVDYQISSYAPSNFDIMYSQYLMFKPEFRYRRHEFMQYYFTEFLNVLKKINFQGILPKYSSFQIAERKYRHVAIYLLCTILPMVRDLVVSSLDKLKDIDMSQLVETPNAMTSAYEHPEFIEDMRQFLPILLREGYLD